MSEADLQSCTYLYISTGYQKYVALHQTYAEVADVHLSQVIVCTHTVTESMTCCCRFEDLLRSLTVERKDICDAMIFALDNADSAFEVHSAQPCTIS